MPKGKSKEGVGWGGWKVREAEAGPSPKGTAAIASSGGQIGFIQTDTASQDGQFWLWCGGQNGLGTACIRALPCFLSDLFSCSCTATSSPLLSLYPPSSILSPAVSPASPSCSPSLTRVLCKTALCPSRPSTSSIPEPSVRLWEGAPTPPCRAPLRCSPPAAQPPPTPALRSLHFGLLVSVSKVTPTASRSSPELPAGFPDAVHQLGFVPHCLSQFSRTFLHPATASALGEHCLHLAKGKAGLCSTFSPEKFPRNSGLSIQDHSRASWLSWRPSGRPRAAPPRRGGFPRGLPSESSSSWWESGQQESKRAHTAFLSLLLAVVAPVGAGAGSAPDRSPAVPVPSPQ